MIDIFNIVCCNLPKILHFVCFFGETQTCLFSDETGVLFIEGGILEFIYCHILNNGSVADNVTIGVTPGSTYVMYLRNAL